MSDIQEALNVVWAAVVLAGLGVLFAAGLRVRVPAAGWRRPAMRVGVAVGAAAVVILANAAFYRHDAHVDATSSGAFTPSSDARRVIQGLTKNVELVYFFQKDDPAGRAMKSMVEIMGRANPHLRVRTVDPDQHPGVAAQYGVRLYNVAVLRTDGREVQVVTTDDRDVALGILRVTRTSEKVICFAVGHGEYDIDNFEFHTHFEGVHSHSHDIEGTAVVLTTQHGAGRLRRALEQLGFTPRRVTLPTAGRVPPDCAALVEVNPRTLYSPPESAALADYLAAGGRALLLYDIGFPVEPRLASLLATAGIAVGEGAVVDPLDHYFTDEEMVAIAGYARHPITRGIALSFYPGIRPLELLSPAPGITVSPLFTSSPESYVRGEDREAKPGGRRARPLAVAAEGVWPGASGGAPFRLVVAGDADFASNSFFPYMSNADLVLAMVAWLVGEERAPTMRPPVEVLPRVILTNSQVNGIFGVSVFLLPGAVVLTGAAVWWRRRQ